MLLFEKFENESATALFVAVSLAPLLTGISLTTSVRTCAILIILIAAAIAHEAFVLDVSVPDLWPHLFVGTVLCNCGALAMRGESDGLVSETPTRWWGPAIGMIGNVAFTVGTYINMGFHRMIEKAHLMGFTLLSAMFAGMLIEVLMVRRGAPPPSIAALRRVRSVNDPAVLFGVGVLFVGHTHDPSPVSFLWHKVMGVLLCLLALTQCGAIGLGALPRDAPLLLNVRRFHAFMWILNGATWIHVGFFLNLFHVKWTGLPRGVHHLLNPPDSDEPPAIDSVCLYLAFDVYASAICVAYLTVCRRRGTTTRHSVPERVDGKFEQVALMEQPTRPPASGQLESV